jgi:hypothetical protein
MLLASPVVLPLLVLTDLAEALCSAATNFGHVLRCGVSDDLRWLYRDVYRPARFGSVWDEKP